MVHEGSVSASVFRKFLKRLMIGATKPVFMVVDGHPIHKAKLVTSYVESLAGQLRLFYLRPHSPQLNPDEQVWAHVKRQIAKRFVQDKDNMKRLAIGALRRIQTLPNLVKSFFQQPEWLFAGYDSTFQIKH
jgi:transposase